MLSAGLLFARVSGLLKRIPAPVWVALALVVGVHFYGHHRESQGYAKAEAYWKAEAEALKVARQVALDSEEAALRQLTKETDNAINQSRIAHSTTVERFIARGGVRQACPADRDPEDRSAGDSATVHQAPVVAPAEPVSGLVTVLPDDVRICSDNTFLAEGFREKLLKLENQAGE